MGWGGGMVGSLLLVFFSFFFFWFSCFVLVSCWSSIGVFCLSPSLQAVCYAMSGSLDSIVFLSIRHVISFRKRDVLIILCYESWFFRLPSWR